MFDFLLLIQHNSIIFWALLQQSAFFLGGLILILFPQPPIQVYGVEGRYATALFSAASKQKNLDKVEQELGRVAVS